MSSTIEAEYANEEYVKELLEWFQGRLPCTEQQRIFCGIVHDDILNSLHNDQEYSLAVEEGNENLNNNWVFSRKKLKIKVENDVVERLLGKKLLEVVESSIEIPASSHNIKDLNFTDTSTLAMEPNRTLTDFEKLHKDYFETSIKTLNPPNFENISNGSNDINTPPNTHTTFFNYNALDTNDLDNPDVGQPQFNILDFIEDKSLNVALFNTKYQNTIDSSRKIITNENGSIKTNSLPFTELKRETIRKCSSSTFDIKAQKLIPAITTYFTFTTSSINPSTAKSSLIRQDNSFTNQNDIKDKNNLNKNDQVIIDKNDVKFDSYTFLTKNQETVSEKGAFVDNESVTIQYDENTNFMNKLDPNNSNDQEVEILKTDERGDRERITPKTLSKYNISGLNYDSMSFDDDKKLDENGEHFKEVDYNVEISKNETDFGVDKHDLNLESPIKIEDIRILNDENNKEVKRSISNDITELIEAKAEIPAEKEEKLNKSLYEKLNFNEKHILINQDNNLKENNREKLLKISDESEKIVNFSQNETILQILKIENLPENNFNENDKTPVEMQDLVKNISEINIESIKNIKDHPQYMFPTLEDKLNEHYSSVDKAKHGEDIESPTNEIREIDKQMVERVTNLVLSSAVEEVEKMAGYGGSQHIEYELAKTTEKKVSSQNEDEDTSDREQEQTEIITEKQTKGNSFADQEKFSQRFDNVILETRVTHKVDNFDSQLIESDLAEEKNGENESKRKGELVEQFNNTTIDTTIYHSEESDKKEKNETNDRSLDIEDKDNDTEKIDEKHFEIKESINDKIGDFTEQKLSEEEQDVEQILENKDFTTIDEKENDGKKIDKDMVERVSYMILSSAIETLINEDGLKVDEIIERKEPNEEVEKETEENEGGATAGPTENNIKDNNTFARSYTDFLNKTPEINLKPIIDDNCNEGDNENKNENDDDAELYDDGKSSSKKQKKRKSKKDVNNFGSYDFVKRLYDVDSSEDSDAKSTDDSLELHDYQKLNSRSTALKKIPIAPTISITSPSPPTGEDNWFIQENLHKDRYRSSSEESSEGIIDEVYQDKNEYGMKIQTNRSDKLDFIDDVNEEQVRASPTKMTFKIQTNLVKIHEQDEEYDEEIDVPLNSKPIVTEPVSTNSYNNNNSTTTKYPAKKSLTLKMDDEEKARIEDLEAEEMEGIQTPDTVEIKMSEFEVQRFEEKLGSIIPDFINRGNDQSDTNSDFGLIDVSSYKIKIDTTKVTDKTEADSFDANPTKEVEKQKEKNTEACMESVNEGTQNPLSIDITETSLQNLSSMKTTENLTKPSQFDTTTNGKTEETNQINITMTSSSENLIKPYSINDQNIFDQPVKSDIAVDKKNLYPEVDINIIPSSPLKIKTVKDENWFGDVDNYNYQLLEESETKKISSNLVENKDTSMQDKKLTVAVGNKTLTPEVDINVIPCSPMKKQIVSDENWYGDVENENYHLEKNLEESQAKINEEEPEMKGHLYEEKITTILAGESYKIINSIINDKENETVNKNTNRNMYEEGANENFENPENKKNEYDTNSLDGKVQIPTEKYETNSVQLHNTAEKNKNSTIEIKTTFSNENVELKTTYPKADSVQLETTISDLELPQEGGPLLKQAQKADQKQSEQVEHDSTKNSLQTKDAVDGGLFEQDEDWVSSMKTTMIIKDHETTNADYDINSEKPMVNFIEKSGNENVEFKTIYNNNEVDFKTNYSKAPSTQIDSTLQSVENKEKNTFNDTNESILYANQTNELNDSNFNIIPDDINFSTNEDIQKSLKTTLVLEEILENKVDKNNDLVENESVGNVEVVLSSLSTDTDLKKVLETSLVLDEEPSACNDFTDDVENTLESETFVDGRTFSQDSDWINSVKTTMVINETGTQNVSNENETESSTINDDKIKQALTNDVSNKYKTTFSNDNVELKATYPKADSVQLETTISDLELPQEGGPLLKQAQKADQKQSEQVEHDSTKNSLRVQTLKSASVPVGIDFSEKPSFEDKNKLSNVDSELKEFADENIERNTLEKLPMTIPKSDTNFHTTPYNISTDTQQTDKTSLTIEDYRNKILRNTTDSLTVFDDAISNNNSKIQSLETLGNKTSDFFGKYINTTLFDDPSLDSSISQITFNESLLTTINDNSLVNEKLEKDDLTESKLNNIIIRPKSDLLDASILPEISKDNLLTNNVYNQTDKSHAIEILDSRKGGFADLSSNLSTSTPRKEILSEQTEKTSLSGNNLVEKISKVSLIDKKATPFGYTTTETTQTTRINTIDLPPMSPGSISSENVVSEKSTEKLYPASSFTSSVETTTITNTIIIDKRSSVENKETSSVSSLASSSLSSSSLSISAVPPKTFLDNFGKEMEDDIGGAIENKNNLVVEEQDNKQNTTDFVDSSSSENNQDVVTSEHQAAESIEKTPTKKTITNEMNNKNETIDGFKQPPSTDEQKLLEAQHENKLLEEGNAIEHASKDQQGLNASNVRTDNIQKTSCIIQQKIEDHVQESSLSTEAIEQNLSSQNIIKQSVDQCDESNSDKCKKIFEKIRHTTLNSDNSLQNSTERIEDSITAQTADQLEISNLIPNEIDALNHSIQKKDSSIINVSAENRISDVKDRVSIVDDVEKIIKTDLPSIPSSVDSLETTATNATSTLPKPKENILSTESHKLKIENLERVVEGWSETTPNKQPVSSTEAFKNPLYEQNENAENTISLSENKSQSDKINIDNETVGDQKKKIIPDLEPSAHGNIGEPIINVAEDAKETQDRGDVFTNPISVADPIFGEEGAETKVWKEVSVGGVNHSIDMQAIEPYKNCIRHGGYYGSSLNCIIVFSSCYLPTRDTPNYQHIMDNLFFYIMNLLETVVMDEYKLVYFHGTKQTLRVPPNKWLKKCYLTIDRQLKKKMSQMLVVHPTFWLKALIFFFASSKFSKKLFYFKNLESLAKVLPTNSLPIPEEVLQYNNR